MICNFKKLQYPSIHNLQKANNTPDTGELIILQPVKLSINDNIQY